MESDRERQRKRDLGFNHTRTCSISVLPGRRGCCSRSSPSMQPTAHISIAADWDLLPRSNSGARYLRSSYFLKSSLFMVLSTIGFRRSECNVLQFQRLQWYKLIQRRGWELLTRTLFLSLSSENTAVTEKLATDSFWKLLYIILG